MTYTTICSRCGRAYSEEASGKRPRECPFCKRYANADTPQAHAATADAIIDSGVLDEEVETDG